MPTDLQSVVFDRFTNPAKIGASSRHRCYCNTYLTRPHTGLFRMFGYSRNTAKFLLNFEYVTSAFSKFMEPPIGIEPMTYGLQNRRSNQLS
jgi:hypothetical protein